MGYTPHVLVVGGGVTGTAVARDLAIRGLEVTLVERGHLTAGTTGRTRAVLYSGARFAIDRPNLAGRCLQENRTLRRVASHCITDTGGLLVSLADDATALEERLSACRESGIGVDHLTGGEGRETEPALGEDVQAALRTSDAVVDPFRLTVATARDAHNHGATIRTHTTVTDVLVEDGAVVGVEVVHDPPPDLTGEDESTVESTVEPAVTVTRKNEDGEADESDGKADEGDDETDEGGGEADDGEADEGNRKTDEEASGDESKTAAHEDESGTEESEDSSTGDDATDDTEGEGEPYATDPEPPDVPDDLIGDRDVPGAGSTDDEPTGETEVIEADYVVNAAGTAADDIAALAGLDLPLERSRSVLAVAGSTPVETVVTRCGGDGATVTPYDGHCVLGVDGSESVADILESVRRLVPSLEGQALLRSATAAGLTPPEEVVVNHGMRDDCWGMTTALGEALTTHRAVAEAVTDQVCGEFGIDRACRTDELPLPGSEGGVDRTADFGLPSSVAERARRRLGSRAERVLATDGDNPVVCECQAVTRAEIRDAMDDPTATPTDIHDVRIRTSATMGRCQGGLCAHRIAAELYPEHEHEVVEAVLTEFLDDRWRGQRDVLWGETLRQATQTYQLHAGVFSRDTSIDGSLDVAAFDDGPDDDRQDRGPHGGYPT